MQAKETSEQAQKRDLPEAAKAEAEHLEPAKTVKIASDPSPVVPESNNIPGTAKLSLEPEVKIADKVQSAEEHKQIGNTCLLDDS